MIRDWWRPLLALVALVTLVGINGPLALGAASSNDSTFAPGPAVLQSAIVQNEPNAGPRGATATPTRTPTKTPSPTSTSTGQSGPRVNINANLFPSVNPTLLRPGDVMKGQSIRSTPAVPVLDSVFVSNCLGRLNAITTAQAQQYGLQGQCDFSAWEDAQKYAHDSRLPSWVQWFEFDFEGSMTPTNEFNNPVSAVTTFSSVVHAAGKKVIWTPTRSVFLKTLGDGDLAKILPLVDAVEDQYQNAYTTQAKLVSDITSDAGYVHGHGTALFDVQLWAPTESCSTQVAAFNAIATMVDIEQIGTHTDGSEVACVLAGIR
jgi:hypothetical protein